MKNKKIKNEMLKIKKRINKLIQEKAKKASSKKENAGTRLRPKSEKNSPKPVNSRPKPEKDKPKPGSITFEAGILPWDDKELIDLVEIAGYAGVTLKELMQWKEKYRGFPKALVSKEATGTEDAYDIEHVDRWLRENNLVEPARIISMINLKGGVGKTTTSVGLATILSGVYNKKVLFIDLDPQTNGTIMLIGEDAWSKLNKNNNTLASLFKDAVDGTKSFNLKDTLQESVSGIEEVKSLDLLPSSIDLIDIQDRLITANPGIYGTNRPVDILKRGIRPLLFNYDYILIDCPPNMGLITQNGINISDSYIIPTIPDVLSTYGIPQITSRIRDFSANYDHRINCLGIVVTKYRSNFSTHIRTIDELKAGKDATLFKTVFPENNQIAEAAEYQRVNTIRQKWGYQGQFDLLKNFANEIITGYK